MKLTLKTLLTICLLSLVTRAFGVRVAPQERDGDSLEVSLLTCAPGHEVYRLYGHTALRVRNVARPNGLYVQLRLVLVRYAQFCDEIRFGTYGLIRWRRRAPRYLRKVNLQDDAQVTAQVLALTPEEAHDVAANAQCDH